MRVLVTGITGFVGGHLAERLVAGGHAVSGFSTRGAWPAGLEGLSGKAELTAADLLDPAAVRGVIDRVRPEWVFHLAGYANPGKSSSEPENCRRLNVDGSRVLFEAVIDSKLNPRVLFASTGLVYGDPLPGGPPIAESATPKPTTPYAKSKLEAETLATGYHQSSGLEVVVARLFNSTGRRQEAAYAVPDWASQIVAIERGKTPPVVVTRDLSGFRDFTDVRDVAEAFAVLIGGGAAGEVYNVATGRVSRPLCEVLARLKSMAEAPVDPHPHPPLRETERFTVDAGRLRALGWQPKFTLDDTLADVLAGWRTA